MDGVVRIQASNMVLKVNSGYDPHKLNIEKWDNFLDVLCGDRSYQKEAIKTAIVYLASGQYETINALAKENYKSNEDLRERFKTYFELENELQLKNKLSGVIDLATGTGKSYVMYGIAQIMLSLQIVKRVLVLCPSLTIENELQKKFTALAMDSQLKSLIPGECRFKNPRITDANTTIIDGDICIENIHAVYENTGSSIGDSFSSGGQDTLVLSDEVHHVYNSSIDRDIKKWKSFLMGNINFKYMLGFTGTAYIDNEYFPDVLYRFSLRQAIEQGYVKIVEYVSKDESVNQSEKFQKIYDNHLENKRKYSSVKPLSIIASKDIKSAENLVEDFVDFLVNQKNIAKEQAISKVLLITSAPKHRKNLAILRTVDDRDNSVEWIFSVSMLTEGWDVKNVFQIVPWEDRAFNSKLLIAQLLGRGLRVPIEFSTQPKVRVFNHANWSKSIQLLVDEVMETEVVLSSRVLSEQEDRGVYNFTLHTLDYTKEDRVVEKAKKNQETFNLSEGIKLVSMLESEKKETEYEDTLGNLYTKKTSIQKETTTVNEIVSKINESFKGRELEAKLVLGGEEYQKEQIPSADEIKKFIYSSMKACGLEGDRLTLENAQKIYGKFTGLLRKKPSTPVFVKKVDAIHEIKTADIKNETARYSVVKRDMTLFVSDAYQNELKDDERDAYDTISAEMKTKQIKIVNKYCLKTPISIVFTTLEPEKKFVELLTSTEMSGGIDAWIKSRDVGFYSIDYQKNKGSKFQGFNPDFFIKKGNFTIVVETKADNDDSEENKAKYRAAKRHFELLNSELKAKGILEQYIFCFLSPQDYQTFEQFVLDGRIFDNKFRSHLEDLLETEGHPHG
ncbi:MAG: DEAD/DEAH box helicase family protein [Eubacterium sp.]